MKFEFEQHCVEDELELYARDRLGLAETERLEEHILICDNCRTRLDHTDRYVKAMRAGAANLRQRKKSSALSGWFSARWFRMPAPAWAMLAVAPLAVILLFAVQFHRNDSDGSRASISLMAERGAAVTAPANRPLDLKLDTRGLEMGSTARVEIVTESGKSIDTLSAPHTGDTVQVRPPGKLAPGSYLVRLYKKGESEPAREFAVEVR